MVEPTILVTLGTLGHAANHIMESGVIDLIHGEGIHPVTALRTPAVLAYLNLGIRVTLLHMTDGRNFQVSGGSTHVDAEMSA